MLLDAITQYDRKAFLWCMRRKRAASIAKVARFVSHIGDGHLYAVLGIVLYLFAGDLGEQFFATGLAAFCIELPLYLMMKKSIKRNRPFEAIVGFSAFITPSDKFSFPSGHTAAAFVMAVLIAHFYPAFMMPAFAMALAIGCSRVLLGVHYPTDIAAGASLGSLAAFVAIFML